MSLDNIRTLGEELQKIEAQLDNAVAMARAEGISWDKIGRAFGITRQGAQKRWDLALTPSAKVSVQRNRLAVSLTAHQRRYRAREDTYALGDARSSYLPGDWMLLKGCVCHASSMTEFG